MASNIMRYKVKVEGCPLLMLFLLLQATNLLECSKGHGVSAALLYY